MKRIAVGRIRGTHGVRGELKVETFDPDSRALRKGTPVWIGEETAPRTVTGVRPHGPALLVSLEGVRDRDVAQSLNGHEISVERASLPKLDRNEFYLADLIGFRVVDTAGNAIGTLEGELGGAVQTTLIVLAGDRELLVPAVEGILVSIDGDAQTITIQPPEGLFDQ